MVVPPGNTRHERTIHEDVNVTLHDVVERSVVDSAGFFANDIWMEKQSRHGNVRRRQ